jgi:hypothetical protein
MNKLLILIPIALFALFIFSARRGKYNEYHKAKISGKIDTVYRYREYFMVTVNGVEYRIIPYSSHYPFVARKGDVIYKEANKDTLSLLHEEDELFYYTVKKY